MAITICQGTDCKTIPQSVYEPQVRSNAPAYDNWQDALMGIGENIARLLKFLPEKYHQDHIVKTKRFISEINNRIIELEKML